MTAIGSRATAIRTSTPGSLTEITSSRSGPYSTTSRTPTPPSARGRSIPRPRAPRSPPARPAPCRGRAARSSTPPRRADPASTATSTPRAGSRATAGAPPSLTHRPAIRSPCGRSTPPATSTPTRRPPPGGVSRRRHAVRVRRPGPRLLQARGERRGLAPGRERPEHLLVLRRLPTLRHGGHQSQLGAVAGDRADGRLLRRIRLHPEQHAQRQRHVWRRSVLAGALQRAPGGLD